MSPAAPRLLHAAPLTPEAFAAYGEVIEAVPGSGHAINDGTCLRFDSRARIDVTAAGGEVQISLFRAQPRALPLRLRSLERHPLGSQAFFPLTTHPYLIVVAGDGPGPVGERLHAFAGAAGQGVNYRRNTWHHALIALETVSEFLVVDRRGTGNNCEELRLDGDSVAVSWQPR